MTPDADFGRSRDRVRKTLSLPKALEEVIQAEADEKYNGDFTRAVLERLAEKYPEASQFLKSNPTAKHNPKKV